MGEESAQTDIWREKTQEGWMRRTNEELNNLYNDTNITGVIRAQRLRWAGHVERMAEARVPKQLMIGTIGGKRRKGRPRVRWRTEIENDIKFLKIARWKEKARDRKLWKRTINQAMSQLGSQR